MLLYYWGRALRQAMTGGVTHVFIVLIANNRVRPSIRFLDPPPPPLKSNQMQFQKYSTKLAYIYRVGLG